MFWDAPWDQAAAEQACRDTYGITPRPYWMTQQCAHRTASRSDTGTVTQHRPPWSSAPAAAMALPAQVRRQGPAQPEQHGLQQRRL